MRSVNKVILIGNLTREPEIKTTSSGQVITTFGMATNRQWTTSSGEKRNSAEFHEVVTWAKLAEICKDFLKKGMLVYVEGYLKTRSWDMEDGTRRFRTEIVANDMIILERRGEGGSDYEPSQEVPEMEAPAAAPAMGDNGSAGDDGTTGDDDDAAASDDAVATEEAPAAPAAAAGELSADLHDDDMF